MRRSSVLPTGKTLARTEFTSDRAFQIRAPVGRQPNGTSAAMRSEFHKGYQSISDLRFSGVWEIQAISSCRKCGEKKICHKTSGFSASGGGKFVPHPAAGNGTKGDISSERDIKKRRRLCAAHGANNLEIFCRDMCVAKKYLSRSERRRPLTEVSGQGAERRCSSLKMKSLLGFYFS